MDLTAQTRDVARTHRIVAPVGRDDVGGEGDVAAAGGVVHGAKSGIGCYRLRGFYSIRTQLFKFNRCFLRRNSIETLYFLEHPAPYSVATRCRGTRPAGPEPRRSICRRCLIAALPPP